MKYRIHHLDVTDSNIQEKLDQYINKFDGEVISVLPHVKTFFMFYGSKVDYLLIVEKIKT